MRCCFASLVVLLLALAQPARAAIVVDTVPVGNTGNANDPADGDQFTSGVQNFGAVANDYRIGTYEVTNSQYAAFLNAVAATDTFALHSPSTSALSGITRSGVSGSFTYAVKTDMGDKPVINVSFWDATRFANWLHNDQPTGAQGNGTTETGAYTLGSVTNPTNSSVTRNSGATWFIPSENEWYKAAYYNPATASYFAYPTSSNATPTIAAADVNGNISNPGTNVANYFQGADWNGQDGNVTTVGSAGSGSASPYLTFDQGGNVYEWNEALVVATTRGFRGGSWGSASSDLLVSFRTGTGPANSSSFIGFRVATVATVVPEASQVLYEAILTLGFLLLKRVAS